MVGSERMLILAIFGSVANCLEEKALGAWDEKGWERSHIENDRFVIDQVLSLV